MSSLQVIEVLRILLCALVGMLTGWLLGIPGWGGALAMALYLAWVSRQLFHLYQWVLEQDARKDLTEPPGAGGLWGEVFYRLFRLLREKQRERQALEAIIGRAQTSIAAMREAVVLIDHEGQLEFWNQAAERLLGFRGGQDRGQVLTNLIRHPRFVQYLSRGQFDEPMELASPVDENRILSFSVTTFGQGDRLLLVRDVTRLHQLEQVRKDFVANVSHELKTPLTVIKGYLETLLDTLPAGEARLHRALLQMQQQSRRMESLVTDLLLLSRLESTDSSKQVFRVAVQPLMQRLRDTALELAPDKQQVITVDVPETAIILGDAGELESAFSNLVSNAVKYTQAQGEIRIRWWEDAQGGHLSVSDTGIGIDSRHIPRLTERFYRPDAGRATAEGGTGLGLAIVKHVLMRHGAKLEIQSVLGKGSTFTCHFPMERLPSAR